MCTRIDTRGRAIRKEDLLNEICAHESLVMADFASAAVRYLAMAFIWDRLAEGIISHASNLPASSHSTLTLSSLLLEGVQSGHIWILIGGHLLHARCRSSGEMFLFSLRTVRQKACCPGTSLRHSTRRS